ncbi:MULTISPECIES: DUF5752 family protein [Methylobacter]|uniref:DUF5752 family protein n=1 Tax=Methylobacter TaxID=429 RepID=UPI000371857C|nr:MULTISPECIES: DUF5752 family protein [Methylobacter]
MAITEPSTEAAMTQEAPRFTLRDCTLIAIATGKRARTLTEFRDHIIQLSPDSLYYHFWGNLLQARFEEREYNNDFAAWVHHSLHDAKLAEQLAVVDPSQYADMSEIRQQLLEYIEVRLEESEYLHWVIASQPFEFIRSQIVVFNAHADIANPREMAKLMPKLSVSSVFYHFIDARRRSPERIDDFHAWLNGYGETYQTLIELLSNIDPYFGSLTELRQQLVDVFQDYFDYSMGATE